MKSYSRLTHPQFGTADPNTVGLFSNIELWPDGSDVLGEHVTRNKRWVGAVWWLRGERMYANLPASEVVVKW